MLSLPTNFQTAITNKEINKILYVRLYYTATDFTGFSSKSMDIDDRLSFGAIVNYSPSRSTWNWNSDNTVTITTPTLSIANIETPDGYRFIDDIYDNNYLGKKCQIYIGFEAYSSTVDDMVKIFDGTVDDIEFNIDNNDINIVLRSQNLPKSEIQGRLVDYERGLIGNTYYSSLVGIDSQNKYLPIAFGKQLFAPTVAIDSPLNHDNMNGSITGTVGSTFGHWEYVANDYYTISANPAITANISSSQLTKKLFFKGGNEFRNLVTIEDEGYYVPVMERGYDYHFNNDVGNVYNIQSLSGLQKIRFSEALTSTTASPYFAADIFYNVVPYRFNFKPTLNRGGFINHSATGKSTNSAASITGSFANIFNGSGTDYCIIDSVSSTNGLYSTVWVELDNAFYENYRSDIYNNGEVLFKNRKLHTPSNTNENGVEATIYKDETAVISNPRSRFYLFSFVGSVTGGYCVQSITNNNIETFGGYEDGSYGQTQFRNNCLGDYGYQMHSCTGNFSGTLDLSRNPNYNDGIDEYNERSPIYELWGISRDSAEYNYHTIKWDFSPNIRHSSKYWNINMAFRSEMTLDYENIHMAINGVLVATGQLLSNTASTIQRRPYNYIELMLRYAASATHSSFSNNWVASAIDSRWENLFNNERDYSGFSITQKTKFDDFLKEYIKYEPFTVYKNEDGKYDIIMQKESYELSDVNYTMNFNDCTSFELSYSDLDKVAWKINNLSNEFNPGLDIYSNEYEYKINYPFYSNTYYGEDSERFVIDKIEKKYTSQSKPEGVNYGGNSYYIRQAHLSTSSSPTANADNYVLADAYDSTYPNWAEGVKYQQNGTEGISIAKYILNQFGNRHRIVKFSTPNYEAFKLQLGDILLFSNVPYKCLGLEFSGWNGNTSLTYIDNINGQRVYAYFMINSITKYQDRIEVECFNLHRLDDFTIESNGTNYKAQPRRKNNGLIPFQEAIR